MRGLLFVIPFVLADWAICADAATKRGGGRSFPAVDDKRGGGRVFDLIDEDKRGGGRAFELPSDKRGGGRAFELPSDKRGGGRAFELPSDKRGGGRSFPVSSGDESTEKRRFDASFEKRGGGRAFYFNPSALYDRNSYYNLMKRPGGRAVDSFNGISPYSQMSDGWYRRKRPGARPFFGNVYAKKGGGRNFVLDSDEYSD